MKKARFAAVSTVILLTVFLTGCIGKSQDTAVTASGFLMDTYVSITAYGAGENGQELLYAALDYMAELEKLFSRTIEGSDVWRINNAVPGEAISIIPDVVSLILMAEGCRELSGGLFDVTIGAVTELWDFNSGAAPPERDSITSALAAVGDGAVTVDPENNTVRVLKDGVRLDLGGIAKGYIARLAGEFLRDNGVTAAVIDAGGDICLIGAKAQGTWNISIMDPYGGGGSLGILRIDPDKTRSAVVTSGSYQRSFTYGGNLYHHILDPATGYPRTTDLVSVTVVADDTAWADAVATVVFMLGSEEGLEFIEDLDGVEAVFALASGEIMVSSGIKGEHGIVFERK